MSATTQSATAYVRRPYRALRFTRDEELVRLLRAGDERAFEAMYDRHHRGILAFCRHMLGSAEEAEDTVQHTFIAAHRDLVGSDKPIQLKAWLYTIARNRCLSVLRARKEERALDDVPEPSVQGLTAEVQQREDLRDLLADLQRLPEDQRAALVLSELGALSHEEIGATLGVRKDKVKALVFQARESLASSRSARDADCREIQEQLSVLRGGSLRRTTLRRHIEVCPACAAFKAEVKRQRSAMAAILPVVPSLALKESVLAAIFGGGAAGGGGIIGGGLLAAGGSKALVAKVATVAVVAGGATGGGLVAVDEISNGGDGNTATAMAGVPPEQRSVRMVDALRERATETAGQRAVDRGTPPPPPSGSTASTAAAAEVFAGVREGEPRVKRRRTTRTARVRAKDAPEPIVIAAPAPEAPAPVTSDPEEPKAGKRESEKGDDRAARKTNGGGKSKGGKKGVDTGATAEAVRDRGTVTAKALKDKGKGLKDKAAKALKKRGPGIDPQPERGKDGPPAHQREAAARRVRAPKRKKLPNKAPQPLPAAAPPIDQRDGRDDRERGRGKAGKDREDAKKTYAAAADLAGERDPTDDASADSASGDVLPLP